VAFHIIQNGMFLLAVDLLRGGITGMATGIALNKWLPRYAQGMMVNAVLGAIGYWAGACVWATISSAISNNRNVENLWIVAAFAGSIAVVAIGDISMSRISLLLNKQMNAPESGLNRK
jgi:uncharacterized membrane protein YeaQ/YmgE (transglycosylase-associated protein family)